MKSNQLVVWLFGGMLTLIILLIGMIYSANNNRFERMESKIDVIQTQYSSIPDIGRRLDRIERQLDSLLHGRAPCDYPHCSNARHSTIP